jgi:hypothetical protein
MATTDTMLVGSFKDRSLSNLHVKKKIRRLSYAPFSRKETKATATKTEQHKLGGEKKQKKEN